MKQQFIDTRTYKYHNPDTGRNEAHHIKYSIMIRNNKVENVFNEYEHSVLETSEVFEYYSNKFNK